MGYLLVVYYMIILSSAACPTPRERAHTQQLGKDCKQRLSVCCFHYDATSIECCYSYNINGTVIACCKHDANPKLFSLAFYGCLVAMFVIGVIVTTYYIHKSRYG